MIQHSLNIAYKEYSSPDELNDSTRLLLSKAWEACKSAYAPYSKFNVGAALELETGLIVTGNNQENAAYPSGLCAERVAVFNAASNYPGIAILNIAVVARTEPFGLQHPVTPCGACRQVLAEYENLSGKPISIWMQGSYGLVWMVNGMNNLLPLMFQGEKLKK